MKAMAQLSIDIGKMKLLEEDILVEVPYCPRGGIRSAHLVSLIN